MLWVVSVVQASVDSVDRTGSVCCVDVTGSVGSICCVVCSGSMGRSHSASSGVV